MKIKGRVAAMLPHRGMIFVQTDDGFSMIELFGDEAELGDVLSGNLHTLGSERIRNETRGESWEVMIQNCHMSEVLVRNVLRDWRR